MTDIEASTEKWERYLGSMRQAVSIHDDLLRTVIEREHGQIVKTGGDSCFAAFSSPESAARAAATIQAQLAGIEWPTPEPIRVRMALNSGFLTPEANDYYGPPVNRLARMVMAGHGGQVLVSDTTANLLDTTSGWRLRDLGRHRLPGVAEAQRIFQLETAGEPLDFPPLRTPEVQPNNLPVDVTTFLGRDEDVERLAKLIRKPETPIITLTGPGGVGKSRLAARAAEDVLPHFQHGVWWVSLSHIPPNAGNAELAARAMAAMHMSAPEGDPVEALAERLCGKESLLIWDNFEHQMATASLVAALMRSCQGIKQVVTSRELLQLTGEHEYVVDVLNTVDAVRLFEATAQRSRPSYSLGADQRWTVEEICRRLDCLPLAVELAAAQARIFTPKQILERLDDRFALLATGARDVEERQRSLMAAIDWSYDGLTESQQLNFRELSVLDGPFSIEAAKAVTGCDQILEDLAALRDKSLVRTVELGGEVRFSMLESLREYGLGKVKDHERVQELKRRHIMYFTNLIEQICGRELDGLTVSGVKKLVRAADQIRAAGRYAFELDDDKLIADYIAAVMKLRLPHLPFPLSESRKMLEENLDKIRTHRPPEDTAHCLFMYGALCLTTHIKEDQAGAAIEEALALLRELAQNWRTSAYLTVGSVLLPDLRLSLLGEVAAMAEETGEALLVFQHKHYESLFHAEENRIDEAVESMRIAVEAAKSCGDASVVAAAQVRMAELSLLRGDARDAKRILDNTDLSDIEELDQAVAYWALNLYVDCEMILGNYDRSSEWCMQAIAMGEEMEDAVVACSSYSRAAELALLQENVELAESHCQKAYRWLANSETLIIRLPYLFACSYVALARGRPNDALSMMSGIPGDLEWLHLGPWRYRKVAIVAAAEWLKGNAETAAQLFNFATKKGSPLLGDKKAMALLKTYFDDFKSKCDAAIVEAAGNLTADWTVADALAVTVNVSADFAEAPAFVRRSQLGSISGRTLRHR